MNGFPHQLADLPNVSDESQTAIGPWRFEAASTCRAAHRQPLPQIHAAQSACVSRSLKDERGALAAGRRAGGASLTDLETQARI
jgi:hypothetical protein